MLKLLVDEVALDGARENLCYGCGSTRVVSSLTIVDPEQNPRLDLLGWVCKQCRDDMLGLGYEFGDEGFLDDNLIVYDHMEIDIEKVKEFNELFEDKGCRAGLVLDHQDFYYRVEMILDDPPANSPLYCRKRQRASRNSAGIKYLFRGDDVKSAGITGVLLEKRQIVIVILPDSNLIEVRK